MSFGRQSLFDFFDKKSAEYFLPPQISPLFHYSMEVPYEEVHVRCGDRIVRDGYW